MLDTEWVDLPPKLTHYAVVAFARKYGGWTLEHKGQYLPYRMTGLDTGLGPFIMECNSLECVVDLVIEEYLDRNR